MKRDSYDRLAEFQIDKVSVQKDIPIKQLEDESTFGVERWSNFKRSWAELRIDGKVADLRRGVGLNGPF